MENLQNPKIGAKKLMSRLRPHLQHSATEIDRGGSKIPPDEAHLSRTIQEEMVIWMAKSDNSTMARFYHIQ